MECKNLEFLLRRKKTWPAAKWWVVVAAEVYSAVEVAAILDSADIDRIF